MVDDVLERFGQKIVDQLRNDIKNKPIPRKNGKSYVVNASGKLERDLRYEVSNGVLRIYANRYIYQLVFGRPPTSGGGDGSLRRNIRQWIDDKGIVPRDNISKDSLAYLISRKIHQEGTLLYPQGSDLLSAIVNEAAIDELKSELFTEMITDAVSSFKTLKKAA